MASEFEKVPLGVRYDFRPAIVVQGPIVKEADFTLETIRLYRKLHPSAIIVMSTWTNESLVDLNVIGSQGVVIIENEKPEWAGQQNMNLQIISSRAGLEAAQCAGATHAIKTRSDQQICAPDVLEYLFSLQKIFPLSESSLQQQRLIAICLDTFRYRMYGLSDHFLFGTIDDMLRYWSPPVDPRRFAEDVVWFRSLREFSLWRICEVYFCTEFLKSTGWDIKWTLEDYWRAVGSRFCVIDSVSIDLFWAKYSACEFGPWSSYRLKDFASTQIGFRDWALLFSGIDSVTRIPEDWLG